MQGAVRHRQGQGWGGRMMSWLLALALVLLHGSPAAAPRTAALAGLTPLAQDAATGQAPRALTLARQGVDDRSPAVPPDLADLPPVTAAPGAVPLRLALRAGRGDCPPAAACEHPQPRAPPAA